MRNPRGFPDSTQPDVLRFDATCRTYFLNRSEGFRVAGLPRYTIAAERNYFGKENVVSIVRVGKLFGKRNEAMRSEEVCSNQVPIGVMSLLSMEHSFPGGIPPRNS